MAERRENSVLFSLKELRNLEEDRVRQEDAAAQARIDAERKAREDEIRRAKEAEELRLREEQGRIRREQEERERAAREGELRLKESERRAQIEAAARLEHVRIEAEARARVDAKKFPTGWVLGGVIGLLVIAGSVMGYLVHVHNLELAAQQVAMRAEADQKEKVLRAQRETEQRKFQAEIEQLQRTLEKATTDAERVQIRAKMALASETHAAHSRTASAAKAKDEAPVKRKIKAGDTNDPLGGLPGM